MSKGGREAVTNVRKGLRRRQARKEENERGERVKACSKEGREEWRKKEAKVRSDKERKQ